MKTAGNTVPVTDPLDAAVEAVDLLFDLAGVAVEVVEE